jgi:DNA-binding NarL/FixJ family response regulator
VHNGQSQLDPSVQRRLVDSVAAGPPPPPDGLTLREVEVLRLIALGRTNAEIAAQLVISTATVKTHINNLFGKAGLHDRAQAVAYAYTRGICGPRAGGD